MAVRVETLSPLPPPTTIRGQRQLRATTTIKQPPPPPQWLKKQRRDDSSIQATPLPPLLQRPHLPPPSLNPTFPKTSDHTNADQEQQTTIDATASASSILSLMDNLQLPVDTDFYLTLLKDCSGIAEGSAIHTHVRRHRPTLLRSPSGLLLANRLLLIYTATGQTNSARQIFDQMPIRNANTWATMITALWGGAHHREAMQLFVDGWSAGKPAARCFAAAVTTVLRSSLRTRELGFGQQVHALMLKMVANAHLGGALMQFYTGLGHHQSAHKVFDEMSSTNISAEACMISACCGDCEFEDAFYRFREIVRAGGTKNRYTFSSVLPACARIGDLGPGGRQVHGCAIKVGVEDDAFVASGLVDMYVKCGRLEDARRAFEATGGGRDVICWNAMRSAYAQRGRCAEAIGFLYETKAAGVEPQKSVLSQVRTAQRQLGFCTR